SEHQHIEILTLIAKLESSIKSLNINLRKTASFTPNIDPKLTATSSNITISAQQVIQLIGTDILSQTFQSKPKAFFLQVSAAIDKSYADMYQTLLPTIRALITERLQHAKNRLYLSISISLVLMLMVLYFVLGIYFSMKQSVQSLTHSLKLFADGDLDKRIELHTQDELKHIGNSFNLLAEKINFLLADVKSNQNKVQQILDGLLTMAGILLPDGTLDFANSTPLRLSGLKQQDVIGEKLWDCPWFSYSNTAKEQIKNDCLLAAQGEAVDREIEFALLDRKIWVDFSVHPVFGDHDEVKFLVAEARDATRRRLAEEYSKRSQKMDALGKLVGGIAHDYNNMLGVILGYAELLEMKCSSIDKDVKGYITEIIRAGERGRRLTRKMLAFSKSESSNPACCDINKILFGLKDMLAKSLTASVTLNYALYEKAWPIWIDVNELEDAILNMSINAKYAMPEGGSLTIKTQNIHLARDEAKLLGLTENNYLKLNIIDTGCGMDEETKNHIFDPFFSTKGEAGNGLGLSQVFGFVERSGGAIDTYTRLNYGTEFTLYFPYYDNKNGHNTPIDNEQPDPHLSGHQGILVVDDEPALRELAYQILTRFGYKVLTASSGEAALNILLAQSNDIDLVLSDIIMPNMDGYQLAKQISILYPAIKIQLASGFSGNRHTDFNQKLQANMLNKPYSSKELLTNIRLLLNGVLLPKAIEND
ncbi:MAG: response regulator, partial [Methylococcales bacterium]|nr:response regulator [Methylococcales bacterium]